MYFSFFPSCTKNSLLFGLKSNMIYFLSMVLDLDPFFSWKTFLFSYSDRYQLRLIPPLIMCIFPKCSPFPCVYSGARALCPIWHQIWLESKGVAESISGPTHIFHLHQCLYIFPIPVTINSIIKQAGQVSHIHPFQLTSPTCLPLDSGIQHYLWIINGSQLF